MARLLRLSPSDAGEEDGTVLNLKHDKFIVHIVQQAMVYSQMRVQC